MRSKQNEKKTEQMTANSKCPALGVAIWLTH